jgi:hypothetical protein
MNLQERAQEFCGKSKDHETEINKFVKFGGFLVKIYDPESRNSTITHYETEDEVRQLKTNDPGTFQVLSVREGK